MKIKHILEYHKHYHFYTEFIQFLFKSKTHLCKNSLRGKNYIKEKIHRRYYGRSSAKLMSEVLAHQT